MWWCRAAALALALMPIAACGFHPLYGGPAGADTAQALAAITIDPIPDRIGQILRNDLVDRLNPHGLPAHPAYRLKINVAKATSPLAITTEAEVTRFKLTLKAHFALIDLDSGETVYSARTRAVGSYDVVSSDFATLVAEQDTTHRAARAVSEQIMTLLAVFFAGRLGPPG
ncbi:MAG: LPS assembly lipoprotein LptE [Alphaproteobacteria bacterium]